MLQNSLNLITLSVTDMANEHKQSWWNKLSIKKQILISLCLVTSTVIILALAVTVGLTYANQNLLIDDSKNILKSDVVAKTSAISNEKTNTLIALINQNNEGFLQDVGSAIQYTTISGGSSMIPVESYPDNDLVDLKPPVAMNDRSGASQVSLSASSVYFPNQFPNGSNIPTLMSANEALLNDTSIMDLHCIQLFQNYTDVVAVYYGHDSNGFFRKYPGHSTKLGDPSRNYDPRARPWYLTSMATDSDISITDPYLDAFGLGWMITMSYKLRDVEGTIIGVVGIDMLIDTIRTNIVDFQIDNSVSYLIQSNDVVLSAPEWVPSMTSGSLFMVNQITTSPVNAVWNTIKSAGTGSTEAGNFIIIFKEVTIGDQTYYYVTSIPISNALEVVLNHEDDLKKDVEEIVMLNVFIFLGTLVLGLIIAFCFAHWNTRHVVQTEKLTQGLGRAVLEGRDVRNLIQETGQTMREGTHTTNEPARFQQGMIGVVNHMAQPTAPQVYGGELPPPAYSAVGDAGPLPEKGGFHTTNVQASAPPMHNRRVDTAGVIPGVTTQQTNV